MNDKRKIRLINKVIKIVCNYYKVRKSIVRSKSRKLEIVRIRQIAQKLSKDILSDKMSLDFIGEHIGGCNHSTVLNSSKTIGNLIDTDKEFNAVYLRLHKLCEIAISNKLKIKNRIKIVDLYFWTLTIERK